MGQDFLRGTYRTPSKMLQIQQRDNLSTGRVFRRPAVSQPVKMLALKKPKVKTTVTRGYQPFNRKGRK